MKINRSYKVELDPSNEQRTALVGHCGACRWVYNWGLAIKKEAFEKREPIPSAFTLSKQLRAERPDAAPWLTEYSTYVIDKPLDRCDTAFKNFFRRCKEKKKGPKGFPRFKSRKKGIGSISFHKDYTVGSDRIRLPRIGWIRLKESDYIPTTGAKHCSATISERAGRWFVSVSVEYEAPEPEPKPEKVVGVDFGIKTLATCSDGTVYENPKAYKSNLRKLKRLQRSAARKEKGSKNRDKAKRRVVAHHKRIADIRTNALHQISHELTKTNSVIVIEDLNVSGMVKNRSLSQAISDVGFYELRRQLEYKAKWYGCEIVISDRFYPSSKICNSCGTINEGMTLKVRQWTCCCGATHDRDMNAAINLRNLAGATSDNKNACGGESSGAQSIVRETIPCEAGTQQLILLG